jgi:hypothetical protein
VKWLKGEKLKDLKDALIIWMRQMNAKNRTATDKVIKEQVEVLDSRCL